MHCIFKDGVCRMKCDMYLVIKEPTFVPLPYYEFLGKIILKHNRNFIDQQEVLHYIFI